MRSRLLLALSVIALLLTACGGGGNVDTGDEPAPTTSVAPPSGSSTLDKGNSGQAPAGASGPTAGGVGTFSVDGESFDNVPVARCEPFSVGDAPSEADLSLVALVGSMEGLNLDLSSSDGFAMGDNEMITFTQQTLNVDYSRSGDAGIEQFTGFASNDIDDNWYVGGAPMPGEEKTPMTEAPFTRDGDRISGSMTLDQDWPEGSSGVIEVSFDFEIPSEIVDCSL
ncbi:MAG: hypothetical protein WB245_10060 [Acidimicrobiia bacterium]